MYGHYFRAAVVCEPGNDNVKDGIIVTIWRHFVSDDNPIILFIWRSVLNSPLELGPGTVDASSRLVPPFIYISVI